jgi:hypothetical protein
MKWEYRTEFLNHRDPLTPDPQKITDKLNEFAEEGWELVSTSEVNDRWTILLILRRPVPSK